jgi:hypothetical protein
VTDENGWDMTDLSDLKLENSDLTRVEPHGYDLYGTGQVGHGG